MEWHPQCLGGPCVPGCHPAQIESAAGRVSCTGPVDLQRQLQSAWPPSLGFDHGLDALPGSGRRGDLLMIPGPLGVRFRERLVPRIEAGELAAYDQPTSYRVGCWLDLAPRIGEDIFLKLYGHTAREDNAAALLGEAPGSGSLEPMFRDIHQAAAARGLELHWATAYEMFCAVERLTAARGTSLIGASV